MQKLTLFEDIFDALEQGKLCTIRKGRRDIQLGDLLFESIETMRPEIVQVEIVYYCRLDKVAIEDLQNDGFKDHQDLCEKMKRFYPDITPEDEVTVVKFARSN